MPNGLLRPILTATMVSGTLEPYIAPDCNCTVRSPWL